MADVAKAANVTIPTVSKVISGRCGTTWVSKSTRKRILDTATKLGYQKHIGASQLKRGCSDNIGVVISRFGSPFYGKLLSELAKLCEKDGKNMVPLLIADQELCVQKSKLALLQRRVDGIINLESTPQKYHDCPPKNLPIVSRKWLTNKSKTDNFFDVLVNYQTCFEQLIEIMIKYNRESFGLLAALSEESTNDMDNSKIQLFQQTLKKYQIQNELITKVVIKNDDNACQRVYRETLKMLRNNRDLDCLIVDSGEYAVAVYTAIKHAGRIVGSDLAVAAWTDVFTNTVLDPPLAVFDEPHDEVAIALYSLLKQSILNSDKPSDTTVIEAKLILRASLGMI